MLTFDNKLQESLSNISFCDKKCHNLNSNKNKEILISYIKENYDIDVVNKLFNYLNPSIIKNVTYNQHLLGTLTNGNPYLLYLVRVDGVNCCFYIDRKLKNGYQYPKIHFVNYQFDDELFDGTMFSGELVRDNKRRWFYLIDNLLLHKGQKTNNKNIVCRYETITDIFNQLYTQNKMLEICPIQIKKLFHYSQIKDLLHKFIPSLSYQCKGILFYNLNNKYSNYALLFPRNQPIIPISQNKVEEMIKTNKPTLWDKVNTVGLKQSQNFNQNLNQNQNQNMNFKEKSETNQKAKTKSDPNNIIFKVLNTDMPDIYNLYINNSNSELIKYDHAIIPNMKTSKYLRQLFETTDNPLNVKMECRYSNIFKKWIPIKEIDIPISNLEEMESIMNNF